MEVDIDLEVDQLASEMVVDGHEWLAYGMAEMHEHLTRWLATRQDNRETRVVAAAMWTAWMEANR